MRACVGSMAIDVTGPKWEHVTRSFLGKTPGGYMHPFGRGSGRGNGRRVVRISADDRVREIVLEGVQS